MASRLALSIGILAFVLAFPVSAQIILPPNVGPLLLKLTPANPEPGQRVRVSVSSLSFDLETTDISWYANNALISEGPGQTAVDATLNLTDPTTIIVIVTESGDVMGSAEVRIQPGEVDLLWEADSFVPPFYKGRALASPNSRIHAEAHARLKDADGKPIAPGNLTYTWKRNGTLAKAISGKGKYQATFPAPLLFDEDTISVEATAVTGARATASARIPSTDTGVLLYQDHPLFGILYNSALGNSSTLPDVEATVVAIPYFASGVISPTDTLLSYEWRVNGRAVAANEAEPNRLTINAENSPGTARVELHVSHLTDWVMSADGVWNILLNAGFGVDPFENN